MEIALFDIDSKEKKRYFQEKLKKHKTTFFSEPIHKVPTNKYKKAEVIIVFIHSNVTKEILEKLPKLKVILTQSTGTDHIDLKYCKQIGYQVGYVPSYGENTVAEHAFALMLNLARNVHKSYIRTKNKEFSTAGIQGFDLKGKTLGVIGTGKIGLHVIKIAKSFDMDVLAYDVNEQTFVSEILQYKYASFDEVIKNSDIITLHMPYSEKTHHIIDENALRKMKQNAILINTSRGGLIDTKSLYKFLKNGHLGGAGLDVIEGEDLIYHEDELIADNKSHEDLIQLLTDKNIFEFENVIFTPHNAFNSKEAIERILKTTVENLEQYIENKTLKHPVI